MPPIEAVTFDLGDTITDLREGRPEYETRGKARAAVVYDRLALAGLVSSDGREAFAAALAGAIESHYAAAVAQQQGVTIVETLRWFYEREGLAVAPGLVEQTAEAWCLASTAGADPMGRAGLRLGAREVLAALQGRGLRLGVISNTIQPGRYLDAKLARDGLLRYFSATVYSSDAGVAKPHPAIFEAALAALGVAADRAVHVGDRLLNDVAGAQAAGLRAVLIEVPQRVERDPHIRPDARIRELPELLAALASLAGGEA
ncbi:MAG TPA: HAD family hydrolase [Anaerolineae bacterium]